MNIRIEWTYFVPSTKKTYDMKSDFMSTEECLLLIKDLERSGRLKGEIAFYDEADDHWKKKDLLRYVKRFETEPHSVLAYIDGSFDLAQKKAGIGIVIYYEQHKKKWRLRLNEQFDLLEDSNEAEYAALYRLLQTLEDLEVRTQSITVHLDSLVVCNQVTGEWACYEQRYLQWLERIDNIVEKLALNIHYEQIDRKLNKEADQLADQALKGVFIESKIEKA